MLNRKNITLITILLSLLIGEYFFHNKISGIIQSALNKKIKKQGLNIHFKNVNYGYLPPRISLSHIDYTDKKTIFTATNISLSIKIFPLIKGQIKPNKLTIKKANISIKLNTLKEKQPSFSLPDLKFQKISKLIPLDQINFQESKIIVFLKNNIVDLDIKKASLTKLYNKLQLEIQSNIHIRNTFLKDNFHLNTKFLWKKSSFFINFFTLQKENSIVQISGSLKEKFLTNFNLKTKDLYKNINELRAQANIDLLEFSDLFLYFTKNYIPLKPNIDKFSGRVQISGYYYDSKKINNKSLLNLQVDNLKTPLLSLKSISAKGDLTNKGFSSNSIQVEVSKKSSFKINNLKIRKKNESSLLSFDLKSTFLKFEDIIKSLNLKTDNISAPITLDTHCGGIILKNTLIKCMGKGELLNLDIFNLRDSNKILSINKLYADFSGIITKSNFKFSADTTYIDPESQLTSMGNLSGVVDYISGFDLNFEASPVNLSFINEIGGQKLTGLTSIKGNTKGSSKWGEIRAELKNQNLKFNDLFLGENTTLFSYKFPLITLQNISGKIIPSSNSYSGLVILNVEQDDLLLDVKGKNITDIGVRTLFKNLFSLPEQIQFNADFSLFAKKGLDINKMDLKFKSSLNNLELFGERFLNANLNLKGFNGKWEIFNTKLNKDTSSFNVHGYLLGLKTINAHISSFNFKLEDSDFLKALHLELSGPGKLTLNAKGPLKGPKTLGTISLTNTQGSKKNNLGNSNFDYRLFKDSIFLKGNAFNNSLMGEATYPLSNIGTLSYNGTINGLNLLDFLNVNSENAPDAKLLLWSEPNFFIKNILTDSPIGTIKNTSLKLISETQTLISLKQLKNSALTSTINFIVHQSDNQSSLALDFSNPYEKQIFFNGRLYLNFLKPFIPTCELITGEFLAQELNLKFSKKKFSGLGQGLIKNSSFKTNSFPYSFNDTFASIQLSKNLIKFEKISSALVNTKIKGSGLIKLDPNKYSIKFKLNYQDLNLEFPPKILTRSTGRIKLSGNRFPLVLSGDIKVKEGLFSKDILTTTNLESVTPSKFLPSKILRKSTPPATLDMRIQVEDKMRVKTNEANGFAYGFFKALGNPIDPFLDGKIQLKPGFKIYFHDKEFLLNEGSLLYKNKLVTNPDFIIDATSKIKDSNDSLEKSYSLRMLIKGSAHKPDIKFLSQPFLDESQIISLLTIGTVSTQSLGQEITTTEQATYSGLQFGSYLMQKNQALKDLQKQTGTQIGLSSSINSGGVNPKVFIKKRWTSKFSSTLSQTFGNQKNSTLKTEYKLNKKTSSVLEIQNNQTDDASQLINRKTQQGVIFDLGLQYKFEFD